jgi:hypothetical protein
MAEKKKHRIALCTHAFKDIDFSVHYNHMYCMMRWMQEGWDLVLGGRKGLDSARARNQLVEMAKEKECTHMLFMDADHFFPIQALSLLMESSHEAIVSALVCKKGEGFPQVVWMVKGKGEGRKYIQDTLPLDGKIYEVGCCAFGCTLINVEKLLKLDPPYFRDTCEGLPGDSPTNIRSDINICNDFREKLKERVFVDTRILIGHEGYPSIIYPQNAELQFHMQDSIHATRLLREGQQGFWYDPAC